MMTLAQVEERLRESRELGVKDYYITGGEVFINPEIFEEKTFPVIGFVCLIDNRPWRITQNSHGIWSNPISSGEVFEVFRASRLPRDDEKA